MGRSGKFILISQLPPALAGGLNICIKFIGFSQTAWSFLLCLAKASKKSFLLSTG